MNISPLKKVSIYIASAIVAILPVLVLISRPFVVGSSGNTHVLLNFLQVFTLFYFVVFMPLVAFMLILVVPFYVFRLKTISQTTRVFLLAMIVAAMMIIGFLFLWLNINIDFIKPFYNITSVWLLSSLMHVGVVILVVAPLITKERELLVYLMVSLFSVIFSTNYITFQFMTYLNGLR
ncbi:MAG: hypothetical protein C4562_02955 [Actinobacteria bacterium]|nr:MAG: hypothetical protein C4562_02955 [Actinomycetota bacterium]